MINLSPEQEAVADTIDGPVLVMAGAGAGKTAALVERIARLLSRGVAPEEILAITFTNKAGRELRDRVRARAGFDLPWIGTFHGLCARLLREMWDPRFIILDESDAQSVYRRLCRERGYLSGLVIEGNKRDETALCDAAYDEMAAARDRSQDLESFLASNSLSLPHIALVERAWLAYMAEIERMRALDFSGILEKSRDLCMASSALALRFRYIQVDEYQDTNLIQDQLVGLLGGYHRNVCVVGDEKQSIYGWRGADVKNFRDFPRRWPGCVQLPLTTNYRSRPAICATATKIMRQAQDLSYEVAIRPSRDGNGGVVPYVAATADDEASRIVRRIQVLRAGGKPYADCAVLYRAHMLSLPVERALIAAGIPYKISGGLGLLQRAASRDLIAYLRLAARPEDDIAFERALQAPPRGIGPKALELARQCSPGQPLYRAMADGVGAGVFKKAARAAVVDFLQLVYELHGASQKGAGFVLEHALDRSGLLAESRPDDERREIRAAADEMMRLAEGGISIELLLEQVALQSGEEEDLGDRVALSTAHAAKGREWSIVFAIGWDAGTFPSPRSDIEEERRLAYVIITRARDELYIGWPRFRRGGGDLSPSPFLAEAEVLKT